ncbi:MAG: hypothetical protein ACC630_08205 [Nitrospinota bacterium]
MKPGIGLSILILIAIITFTTGDAPCADLNLHGQYRINYYADSKSDKNAFGDENLSAARLRFRPTFDSAINDDISVHIQFNIGHIKDSVFNQQFDFNHRGDNDSNPAFGLRHGFIKAKLTEGITGAAGIIPLSDKFGDTLFSSLWDFNPLALRFTGKIRDINIRVATGKVTEREENKDDDFDSYLLDLDYGGIGGSFYYFMAEEPNSLGAGFTGTNLTLAIYGLRAERDLGNFNISGFIMGSSYNEKDAISSTDDRSANGLAAKLAVSLPVNSVKIGAMAIYTMGDSDFKDNKHYSNSFITPMSLYGGHGYWGFTGKLNIQGPTDTGIDDPVRIDGGSYNNNNLGMGLTTVQVNADFPIINRLDGYVAIGYYTLNDAPANRDKYIGTDVYTQLKWNIGKALNLQSGVDFAALGKGHHAASTGSEYKSRTVTTFFSQLQLEW